MRLNHLPVFSPWRCLYFVVSEFFYSDLKLYFLSSRGLKLVLVGTFLTRVLSGFLANYNFMRAHNARLRASIGAFTRVPFNRCQRRIISCIACLINYYPTSYIIWHKRVCLSTNNTSLTRPLPSSKIQDQEVDWSDQSSASQFPDSSWPGLLHFLP